MSDVLQRVPAKKERRLALRAQRARAEPHACVSFPELVQTHFIRESALEDGEVYTGQAVGPVRPVGVPVPNARPSNYSSRAAHSTALAFALKRQKATKGKVLL